MQITTTFQFLIVVYKDGVARRSMSTWYRAPEIRYLQAQGKLNATLDPWSDSESDDESYTTEKQELKEKKNEMAEEVRAFIRPYEERDREAVAHVVSADHS